MAKSTASKVTAMKPAASTVATRETRALDRLIHEKVRLGIVSALAASGPLTFVELKSLLKTTDGNVSVHARKLEDAGYVTCLKGFNGRVPRTEYALTADGRFALEKYLDHLEALVGAMRLGLTFEYQVLLPVMLLTARSVSSLLQVVIQIELIRSRTLLHRNHFTRVFIIDPSVEEVFRENVTFAKKAAALSEIVECAIERSWYRGHVSELLRAETVNIFVEWLTRVYLVYDAIESRHQQ